jgi:hypothetical protein
MLRLTANDSAGLTLRSRGLGISAGMRHLELARLLISRTKLIQLLRPGWLRRVPGSD